jgi:hypothetical protein
VGLLPLRPPARACLFSQDRDGIKHKKAGDNIPRYINYTLVRRTYRRITLCADSSATSTTTAPRETRRKSRRARRSTSMARRAASSATTSPPPRLRPTASSSRRRPSPTSRSCKRWSSRKVCAVGWASLHGSRGPSLAGRLRRLVLRCNAPLCATNLRRANVWRPLGGGACCDEGYSSSGSGPDGGRGSSARATSQSSEGVAG